MKPNYARRGRLLAALLLLLTPAVAWLTLRHSDADGGRRLLESTPEAAAYFSEFAGVAASDQQDTWTSPDGRYVASSEEGPETYHAVRLRNVHTGHMVQVVRLREADPGSGRSHQMRWSADSRALLIGGSGAVNGRRSGPLCLVYLVEQDRLVATTPCG